MQTPYQWADPSLRLWLLYSPWGRPFLDRPLHCRPINPRNETRPDHSTSGIAFQAQLFRQEPALIERRFNRIQGITRRNSFITLCDKIGASVMSEASFREGTQVVPDVSGGSDRGRPGAIVIVARPTPARHDVTSKAVMVLWQQLSTKGEGDGVRQRRCAEFLPAIVEMKLHHPRRDPQNRRHLLHRLARRRPSQALPLSDCQRGAVPSGLRWLGHSGLYVSMVSEAHHLQQISWSFPRDARTRKRGRQLLT